jgi:epoxide hydrolase-like predicted phosphatase
MTERRRWERDNGLAQGAIDRAVDAVLGSTDVANRVESVVMASIRDRLGLAVARTSELLEVLRAHESVDDDVVKLVKGLRHCYRTGLLTNAGPRRRQDLTERFGVSDLFDVMVVSSEEKIAKPEPEIYRMTARRLDVAPDECVFVDDQKINVDGADRVGMVGIHFTSAYELSASLINIGVILE